MRGLSCGLAAALFVACISLSTNATAVTATYNFDSLPSGTSTVFADTDNGITAVFTSPGDPGGFTIANTFFQTLVNNVLFNPGPAGLGDIPLTITFSQPVVSMSFAFALNDGSNTTSMEILTNAAGVASATGTIPGGFSFPEGVLIFSGAAFTAVTLSSGAFNFAIDNIIVETATAVPLPAALPLFATIVVGGGWIARRRRIRAVA